LREEGANIAMNVTWVLDLPHGNEKGTFLVLDLGGTNLRVCKIQLHGESQPGSKQRHTTEQEQYRLSADVKTGTADELWSYVASYLEEFMRSKGLDKKYSNENPMPLGFTFSYPAIQHKIDHGILKTWTKGFDIKGVEGEDVVAQLRSHIADRNLPVEIICLVNDTVGAMVASAYNDPDTIIGAIFGTGCNAAYMQSLTPRSLVPKLRLKDEEVSLIEKENLRMAINCEYGAFDNKRRVLPVTKYDDQIDAESPRPGEQMFEKLSAGLYLGEIFRLVMLELVRRGLIFKDQDMSKLGQSYILDTGFLSQVENDESSNFATTRDLYQSTLSLTPSDVDIELSRRLAEFIAVRGARLCSCGIAAICTKENITSGHVAADGSVANKHPKFKKRWAAALGEILGWNEDAKTVEGELAEGEQHGPIKLTSAEDGSGVGAAVIAAMTIERKDKGNHIGLAG
jgi:hexokinase